MPNKVSDHFVIIENSTLCQPCDTSIQGDQPLAGFSL